MNDNWPQFLAHNWSADVSILALVVSIASWWHNRSSYQDKRFGDIMELMSDLTQRLTRLNERFKELRDRLRSSKIALHSAPDYGEKYEAIEAALKHAESASESADSARGLEYRIKRRTTPTTPNTREMLQFLQVSAHEVATLETTADRLTRTADEREELVRYLHKRKADSDAEFREWRGRRPQDDPALARAIDERNTHRPPAT